MLFDRIENPVGIEFGEDDAGQSCRQRHDPQPRSADMRARHRDKHRLVIVPFRIGQIGVGRVFPQREQIAVRQHGTFGIAGGPRGIKLQHGIVGTGWGEGRARRRLDQRPCLGVADDARRMVELARQLIGHRVEAGAGEDDLRPGIVDDIGPFDGRKPPADRRHDDPGARGAKEEREIEVAVLADPRDAIALFEPRGAQRACHARRPLLKLGIGEQSVLFAHCNALRPVAGPVGDEFVETDKIRNVGSHRSSLLESRCYLQSRRTLKLRRPR